MKISGFTFSKNADKLHYPVKESIESILPLVDEFIIALGDSDEDDRTEELILSIQSPKIRIIHTKWNLKEYPNGAEYARQTDIAMKECTGDWLFYLQSDEVVHEKDHEAIRSNCIAYLNDPRVEGFLFNYRHFWGSYDHHLISHVWYDREIRIVRNNPDIHSWRDAQSFRFMPDFDGKNYFRKDNTRKLRVIGLDAFVHHYGFVRPPRTMQKKRKTHHENYLGAASTEDAFRHQKESFDYGDLSKVPEFKETHPEVMRAFMARFNWHGELHFGSVPPGYQPHKHERMKYRALTWLEQNLLGGRRIMDFKNYDLIR